MTEPVVLFFKSRVDPYLRNGRPVRGYTNKVVKQATDTGAQRSFLFDIEPGAGNEQAKPAKPAKPKAAPKALDPVDTANKVMAWNDERRRKAGKNAPLTSRAGWISGWAYENKVKVSDADETAILAEIDRVIKKMTEAPKPAAEKPKPKNESSHSTHPLPDKASDGSAVYDLGEDGSAEVSRQSDGSYYGAAEKFDFEAKDAEEMRTKLTRWKAKYVGWEN